MAVDVRDLPIPIGMLRHSLFTDMGPAWLRLDGATEYQRAMYPDLVAKASAMPWLLPGSKASTFRLVNVPAGTATVASGYTMQAGSLIGSDKVTLTAAMLPEHDHGYADSFAEPTTQKGGLLSGLVTILSGLTPKTADKTTGKAGSAKPEPVPIKPPGFVAHLFVFAGRPRG